MQQLQEHEPLSRYSTFRVGGLARFFLRVSSLEDLQEALQFAKKQALPWLVIGRGSNLLFDDRGYSGLVAYMDLHQVSCEGSLWTVEAGASFAKLARETAKAGFGGLEFGTGIPGSVGGAVYMNAGAHGGETADHLTEVSLLTEGGEVQKSGELSFSYRSSPFQQNRAIILSATWDLPRDGEALRRQQAWQKRRLATQPSRQLSAGCIFRNAGEKPAGALLESAGLKGMRLGSAAISEIHANFIVNLGGATAEEILSLAKEAKRQVQEKSGVTLHSEVRYLAYSGELRPLC